MRYLFLAMFAIFCNWFSDAIVDWRTAPIGYTKIERTGMERLVQKSRKDNAIAFRLAKPATMSEAERAKAMKYLPLK